jgi:RNA polymerase sigma-70 factor (ECF subfamily)
MDTTSETLLQRLRRPGDQVSWDRFVTLYTPMLYRWARRAGLRKQDAEDLVQDVLTLLVEKLKVFAYDPTKSFRAWLRTVTLNKWRQRQRRSAPVASEAGHPLDEVPAPDAMVEFEEVEYRRHLVRQALQALRPEFPALTWRAFAEYVVAGRDAAEVAAELRISRGTVYAAKSLVLARLRQEVQGLID